MIKVNLLLFSLVIEAAVLFLGVAFFFFRKYRVLIVKGAADSTAIEAMRKEKEDAARMLELAVADSAEDKKKHSAEVERLLEEIALLTACRDKYKQILAKFTELQEFNSKVKDQLTSVISKLEKNEGLEKMLADLERKDKELNLYVSGIESERKQLARQTEDMGMEIDTLSRVVEGSVDKNKYERLSEENLRLNERIAELETELKERNKVYENLVKKFGVLEREYTVLYEAHKDD